MTQRYTVETIDDAWSYIVGPDGKRDGPWRYRWEAEEEADRLNLREAITHKDPTRIRSGYSRSR
jgi:hypothetical protein